MKARDRRPGRARLTGILIDDHAEVRAALAELLEVELGIVATGEAATRPEAVALLGRRHADVAVVDLGLRDWSEIALAGEARRVAPETKLVLYSTELSPKLARDALAAGFDGVVQKTATPAQLVLALRAVVAGETYVDPGLSASPPPA
jgi:DNA-binding NarL/FixJ family response regulator